MSEANAARRAITPHDLLRLQMADDPRLSPDGRTIAWVRTEMKPESNGYLSVLVLTDVDTGDTRRLTARSASEASPRWSPDGSEIAFVSPANTSEEDPEAPPPAETFLDKQPQLWVARVATGEARCLTSLRGGATAGVWSPSGNSLAFTTLVHPERGVESGPRPAPVDPFGRYNRDVLRVTQIRWKSDAIGLTGDYVRRVAVVPASGGAVQVLGPATGELSAPAWRPDGAKLAVVGNLREDAGLERRASIYLMDPAVSGEEPEPLFTLEEMRAGDVTFAPDGARLAVCGHDDDVKGHYGFQRLWIVDATSGAGTCVTRDHDVSLGDYSRNQDVRRTGGQDSPRWLPGGDALLVLTNREGKVQLERVDLTGDGGSTMSPVVEGDRVVSAFTLSADGRRAALRIEDGATPGEIFAMDVPASATSGPVEPRRVSHVNDALLAELELPAPQRFTSTSGDVDIEGWIHMPVGIPEGETVPVVLYTGGGPGGMRANVFVHEFHLYAARGYAVVNCNARGNYGYGEAFSDATRGYWGGLDHDDNMAFLSDVLAAYPELDGERLAVAGGSYGGYMASWIIAHHPEFKAAVVDRTLFNRYAFTGTSDIGILLDKIEFEGKYPWEVPERYLEASPIQHVGKVVTPTLVVHSALDHRCPVDQGEQLYMALRVQGVTTELVRFPDETHELSRNGRPWHRIYRLESYLDWFDRFL